MHLMVFEFSEEKTMNKYFFVVTAILISILFLNSTVFCAKIEYIGKAKFSDEVLLQFPSSFSVTEDGTLLVLDFKADDVKIYRQSGDFIKLLCRKGYGPNEIADPTFCHYSKKKFIVYDNGQRKIFIYEKKGKFDFKRVQEIYSLDGGFDYYLEGDRLYISGNKDNKASEPFALYSMDIGEKSGDDQYFLPAHLKVGLDSIEEFRSKYYRSIDIAAIGYKGRFDVFGGHAYYCWECDLKVFKINLKTGSISTFGEKMKHYVKPHLSKRMENAWKTMNGKAIYEERAKMSYIWQIFTTPKHVVLIYNLPLKPNEDRQQYMVQFYTYAGDFVSELSMPGKTGPSLVLEKESNLLYTIVREEAKSGQDEDFYIYKYKLTD